MSKKLKFYFRVVNVFLLVLMIPVVAMFLFWKLTPAKLDKLGQDSIAQYIQDGEAQAAVALEALVLGDPVVAQDTLADWEQVGLGDRYYPFKRTLLLSLSQALFEVEEYERAKNVVTPALDENDRDIMLFIQWSQSALHIPALALQAETELKVMAQRFPEHVQLQELYIRNVLHEGDPQAANLALASVRDLAPKTGGWSVLWKLTPDATDYEPRVWTSIEKVGASWGLTVAAPKSAATFRVSLPPNVRMDISNIQVISEDESTAYDVSEVVEANMMSIGDDVLSANGSKSPSFVIRAPEWLKDQSIEPAEIKITFDITNVGLAVDLG